MECKAGQSDPSELNARHISVSMNYVQKLNLYLEELNNYRLRMLKDYSAYFYSCK